MIAMHATVESELLTPRGFKQACRLTNRTVMVEEKIDDLPERFENNPNTRPGGAWGYRKRSAGYQKWKARTLRHQRPLVKTGGLRRAVLASAQVTATANRGRLTARGDNDHPLRPAAQKEIEARSPQDEMRLAKRWDEVFHALAQQPVFQRKRKRG